MKTLTSLFATVLFSLSSLAFAGTEISHRPIIDSADFFKGDAANFRISSLVLDRDPVTITDVSNDLCLETAETPADCHSYTYEFVNVVHVNVTFDSDATQYEDGGNGVTLSIPQDQFSAQELNSIKNNGFSAAKLVKLNVADFVAQISTPLDTSQCLGDESFAECGDKVTYTLTNVNKVRVSATR
jgi:hypothetical protein